MAVDYSKISFSSGFKYMRELDTYSVSTGTPPDTVTITHNLGYVPYFRAYGVSPSSGELVFITQGNVHYPPSGIIESHNVYATANTVVVGTESAFDTVTDYVVKIYEDPLP